LYGKVLIGEKKFHQQRDFWSFKPNFPDGQSGFLGRSAREPRI